MPYLVLEKAEQEERRKIPIFAILPYTLFWSEEVETENECSAIVA